MWLTDHFMEALNDYFYLTSRGYPERGFLKLVGDRYKLSQHQRTILYRGIASPEKAQSRRARLCSIAELVNEDIFVDGLNVLLTLSAYLQGLPLFVAMDGFLRDAASFRGRFPKMEMIEKSFHKLLAFLSLTGHSTIVIYLDNNSAKVYDWEEIFDRVKIYDIPRLEIQCCQRADTVLQQKQTGIICTSDTHIIDQTPRRCLDLACHVLKFFFNSQFVDLSQLVNTLDEKVN